MNIGARDGIIHDQVYPLFKEGYGGLAIEADAAFQDRLASNLAAVNGSNAIFVVMEAAQPPSINALFQKFRVPFDFDCLKIDIDSIDLPILQSILLSGYSPKLIMIEMNPDIPPPFQIYLEFDPQCVCDEAKGAYGASADAIYREASLRGYSLIAFESFDKDSPRPRTEHNMWFVRNDLLGRNADNPLVSWRGMVRMYWAQMARLDCIHVGVLTPTAQDMCPNHQIREVFVELGGQNASWPFARMSSYVAQQDPLSSMHLASFWRWQFERHLCTKACKFSAAVARGDG